MFIFSIKSHTTQVSSKLKSCNIIPDDFRVVLLACWQGLLKQEDHFSDIYTFKVGSLAYSAA
jgi:hypothetical protein